MRRFTCLGWLCVVIQAQAAMAANCNYLSERPRPEWAGGAASLQAMDELQATGQVKIVRAGFSEALTQARQQALANLGEAIQVNVASTTTVSQSKSSAGKRWLTDTNVQSLSSATTNLVLRDVRYDEPWLDRRSCMIWTHVRLSRALVATIQREQLARIATAELKNQIVRADDQELAIQVRRDALDLVESILRDIDFTAIKGESPGEAYYRSTLFNHRRQLTEESNSIDTLRSALNSIDALLSSAQTSATTDAKLVAYRRALMQLEAARQQFPTGIKSVASAVDLSLRGADIELLRNNPCGAARFWSRIDASKQSALPQATRQRFGSLVCQPVDARHAVWRAAFEGKVVNVICLQETSQPEEWTKGCEALATDLRAIGASVKNLRAVDFAKSLAAWANGGVELTLSQAGQDPVMILAASGRIAARAMSDSAPSETEYQFSGNLVGVYLDKGKVATSDRFSATTGWNPVSPQMTMELLALNAYRRFKDKLETYLSAQTSE